METFLREALGPECVWWSPQGPVSGFLDLLGGLSLVGPFDDWVKPWRLLRTKFLNAKF